MSVMSDKLMAWLSTELKKRRWSHNELARQAGVSQAAISNVLSGERRAGADFCVKVAQALGEPPEKMLRLAGILPTSTSENDPVLSESFDLIRNMSSQQRQEALRYLRYLYQSGQDDR